MGFLAVRQEIWELFKCIALSFFVPKIYCFILDPTFVPFYFIFVTKNTPYSEKKMHTVHHSNFYFASIKYKAILKLYKPNLFFD